MSVNIPGLKELLRYFTKSGIHTCILYGSAGTDRFTLNSDIDLAIASTEPMLSTDLVQHYLKAVDCLHREVDIKDLRQAKGIFLKEILTSGEILLNEDHEFLGEKAIEMMDFQADLAPGINEMLKKRLERAVYGK
jgi:predicted nucleotidyltransferase